MRFNPEKAFTPVAILGTGPNALVVFPKLPVNSVKELLAMAKARPGALNYASAGVGSFQHLGSERFRSQGAETLRMTPAEFGKHIRTETAKWSKVVKQAGIKAE